MSHKYIIKLNTGYYIKRLSMNSRLIKLIDNEQGAQTFRCTEEELNQLLKRIPKKLEPEIIMF